MAAPKLSKLQVFLLMYMNNKETSFPNMVWWMPTPMPPYDRREVRTCSKRTCLFTQNRLQHMTTH